MRIAATVRLDARATRTRTLAAAAVSLLLLSMVPRAAAGPGEPTSTERRLERAGIPVDLRGRVRLSLDRAGMYLAGRTNDDGSFTRKGDATWFLGQDRGGVTPLCGLALELCGRRADAEKAIRWMTPDAREVRRDVRGHAYAAGLALLLLEEHGGDGAAVAQLAGDLVAMQDSDTGLWAWKWTPPGTGFGTLRTGEPAGPAVDLDATRLAVVGLASAEATGWRAPTGVWQSLLDGLLRSQTPEGAFAFGGPSA